jgi:hypothetical protein
VRVRALLVLVLVCSPLAARAQATEHCENDVDDDDDGRADCADRDCYEDVSCTGGGPSPEAGASDAGAPEARAPAAEPRREPAPSDASLAYPYLHVDQPLTYRAGMMVPALGISIRNDVSIADEHGHLGLGLTYALFDFWEISILPLPLRVAPVVAYEAPAISSAVRFVEHEVIEVGAYANVAIPVSERASEPELLPTEHLLARSRGNDVAELDLALLLRLHLAHVARIDLVLPVATLVFASEVRADFVIPLRVTFQVAPFAFLGLWSGVVLTGPEYVPKIPLGLVFGTVLGETRQGPIFDGAIRFGWPAFFDPARTGAEVIADGWQITIDARVMFYLLP